jgi:hypothetical protein
MEGIAGWLLLAYLVCFGLMGLSLLPAFAAGVLLLAHRPQLALKLFATALLFDAVVWAASCFIGVWWFSPELFLTSLSLLVAGSGQFVAALRSPRTYAVALGFATGAVLVIVAGPYEPRLLVVVTSLELAVASLMIAVFFPFGSRSRMAVHPSRLSGTGSRTTHCSKPGQVSDIRLPPNSGCSPGHFRPGR